MRKANNLALFLALAIMISLVSGCTVCGNCTNCGPEIIADTYLDGINSLLQGKVQQLGFPLTISRNKTASSITYQIQYSSGLLISLRLNLDNMQIQLLSYSINGNLPTTSTSATTSTTTTTTSQTQSQTQAPVQAPAQVRPIYKSTSDGFYVVENYTNSTEVTQIMSYLSSTFKNILSNFQLIGAEFTNKSQTIFRLKFKFLPTTSGLSQIVQLVFVQYVSPNNCLLIDSNFSSLSFSGSFNTVDTKTILNDPWFSSINTLLVKKYNNLLGSYPQIVSLQESQPYFKIVYQVADTNYSFIVLYDYFQNRILQGNLTSLKTVTTYTQAQFQSNNDPSTSAVMNSVSGSSQGQASISSSSSTSASSTSSLASTSSSTSTTSSSQKTVVNSAQTDSSSSSSKPANPLPIQPVLSATATSVNSQASNTQTVTQSSQSSQVSQTLDIPNFKTNPQVISAVSFLNSLGQSFAISQVQSVQKLLVNGLIYYRITILISSVGSIPVNSQQVIFYQYILQVNSGGSLSVSNTSYTNLNNPSFSLLSLDEVKKDQNIKIIARFLLSQQYPMLGSDSRVLAVYRDLPYYRIIFQGPSNIQLNYVIVFNFNGTVQVLSATSAQDQSQTQSQIQVQSQTTQAQAVTTTPTPTLTTTTTTTPTPTPTPAQPQPQPQAQLQQQVQIQSQVQVTATSQTQIQPSQLPQAQTNTGSSTSSSDSQAASSSQITTSPTTLTQTSSTQTLNIPSQSISTASYQSYQQTQDVAFPQSQQKSNTQSTQNTQSLSVQSVDANSVQLQPVKSVVSQPTQSDTIKPTQTATTVKSSTNSLSIQTVEVKPTIEGFAHFGGPTDPLYAYVTQGMTKINQTLISKGYSVAQINYKDIVYKLESNLLTVLFKVQAGGLLFTYQYKGNIGSAYTLQNSLTPSPIQTSSDTTVTLPGAQSITVKSINYQLASSSITNQPFIKYYLDFLDSSDICYSKQNLIGIYYNSQSQNILLFRYKNATQYYNIATSTADIQRILSIYLGDKKDALLQTQTAVNQKSSNIQTTTTQGQSSTTTPTSTNAPSGNSGVNTQQTSQTITSTGSNSQTVVQGNSQPQQQVIVQQSSSSSNQQVDQTNQQTNLVSQPSNSQQLVQPSQPVPISQKPIQPSQQTIISQPTQPVVISQQPVPTQSVQPTQPVPNIQQPVQPTQPILTNTMNTQTITTAPIVESATSTTTSNQNVINTQVQSSQSTVTSSLTTQKSPTSKPYSASQNIIAANVDPHCLCYDHNKCIKCAHRFYLNNNQCVQVPNECLSYDINTGVCLKCLPGFSLQNGLCELSSTVAYYFSNQCFECLGDYRLVNKKCVYAPNIDPSLPSYPQVKNPLCMSWNNGNCQQCLPGTYLSSRKICELIDPFCSIFDYASETCHSCQVGYSIRNGRCFIKQ